MIKSRRMRWARHVERVKHVRCIGYKFLVGNPEGKRPVVRRRIKDNIKMFLNEVGHEGVDWMNLVQGPHAGSCEHGNASWPVGPKISVLGGRSFCIRELDLIDVMLCN
jgi:hypothetical protein